jgi:hypothetical protein
VKIFFDDNAGIIFNLNVKVIDYNSNNTENVGKDRLKKFSYDFITCSAKSSRGAGPSQCLFVGVAM